MPSEEGEASSLRHRVPARIPARSKARAPPPPLDDPTPAFIRIRKAGKPNRVQAKCVGAGGQRSQPPNSVRWAEELEHAPDQRATHPERRPMAERVLTSRKAERMLISTPRAPDTAGTGSAAGSRGRLGTLRDSNGEEIVGSRKEALVPELNVHAVPADGGLFVQERRPALSAREDAGTSTGGRNEIQSLSRVLPMLTDRRGYSDMKPPDTGMTDEPPPPTGRAAVSLEGREEMAYRHRELDVFEAFDQVKPSRRSDGRFLNPVQAGSQDMWGSQLTSLSGISADAKAAFLESRFLSHREHVARRRELSTRQLISSVKRISENSGLHEGCDQNSSFIRFVDNHGDGGGRAANKAAKVVSFEMDEVPKNLKKGDLENFPHSKFNDAEGNCNDQSACTNLDDMETSLTKVSQRFRRKTQVERESKRDLLQQELKRQQMRSRSIKLKRLEEEQTIIRRPTTSQIFKDPDPTTPITELVKNFSNRLQIYSNRKVAAALSSADYYGPTIQFAKDVIEDMNARDEDHTKFLEKTKEFIDCAQTSGSRISQTWRDACGLREEIEQHLLREDRMNDVYLTNTEKPAGAVPNIGGGTASLQICDNLHHRGVIVSKAVISLSCTNLQSKERSHPIVIVFEKQEGDYQQSMQSGERNDGSREKPLLGIATTEHESNISGENAKQEGGRTLGQEPGHLASENPLEAKASAQAGSLWREVARTEWVRSNNHPIFEKKLEIPIYSGFEDGKVAIQQLKFCVLDVINPDEVDMGTGAGIRKDLGEIEIALGDLVKIGDTTRHLQSSTRKIHSISADTAKHGHMTLVAEEQRGRAAIHGNDNFVQQDEAVQQSKKSSNPDKVFDSSWAMANIHNSDAPSDPRLHSIESPSCSGARSTDASTTGTPVDTLSPVEHTTSTAGGVMKSITDNGSRGEDVEPENTEIEKVDRTSADVNPDSGTRHGISASGLMWENVGTTQPAKGQELINTRLEDALKHQTEFHEEEWAEFGIENLCMDHFILSGGLFFQPTVHAGGLLPLRMQTKSDVNLDSNSKSAITRRARKNVILRKASKTQVTIDVRKQIYFHGWPSLHLQYDCILITAYFNSH